MEPRPGCGPLLATVADYHPAGDSMALPHFAHACPQLPHVSPSSVSESNLLINPMYTYDKKSVNCTHLSTLR